MSTRSGARYKSVAMDGRQDSGAKEEAAMTAATATGAEGGAVPLTELFRLLMEDRRLREGELAEERKRREEEAARHERERREQMDVLARLVETAGARVAVTGEETDGGGGERSSGGRGKVVLTKYVEGDDVEAYLTTFERVMAVHRIDSSLWVVHLAPQLTGRAQQAYAALPAEKAGDYKEVRAAILRRYDVSPETYRQKFPSARKRDYIRSLCRTCYAVAGSGAKMAG